MVTALLVLPVALVTLTLTVRRRWLVMNLLSDNNINWSNQADGPTNRHRDEIPIA